jgi:hypothetical protein
VRPGFGRGRRKPADEREPIAPLQSGISDERIGRAPIGRGAPYLRLRALLQGFALGAGPVGFARRRRRAGRQWVGASSSRDGSLPMR